MTFSSSLASLLLKDPILGDDIFVRDGDASIENDLMCEGSLSIFSTEDDAVAIQSSSQLSTSSKIDSNNLHRVRRPLEKSQRDVACCWGEWDVPLGRAQEVREFIGNIRFRDVVDQHRPAYLQASRKSEKTAISTIVHNIISNNGGRFMDKDKGTKEWMEIPYEKALAKISQTLRNGTRPVRRGQRNLLLHTAPPPPNAHAISEYPPRPTTHQAYPPPVAPQTRNEQVVVGAGPTTTSMGVSVRPYQDHDFEFSMKSMLDGMDDEAEDAFFSFINSLSDDS